jgi:hypothetical protein
MTRILQVALISALALAAGCKKKEPPANPPNPTATGSNGGANGHPDPAARTSLGEVRVGEHAMHVYVTDKVVPGSPAHVDLDVPAGKPLPATVRGWIGAEAGTDAAKATFAKTSDTRLHATIETPKTIPAGGKLWIEVESSSGTSKGSVDLKL